MTYRTSFASPVFSHILNHYPKTIAAEVSVRKPLAIPQSAGAESSIKIIR